jgi:hypothetical protein
MWSAHRIPQLHFQLSKPDRYFFIQVTTTFNTTGKISASDGDKYEIAVFCDVASCSLEDTDRCFSGAYGLHY